MRVKRDDALRTDRELPGLVRPRYLSQSTSRAEPEPAARNLLLLTPEQRANVEAKKRFAKRCLDVLGPDDSSVRELALFFGVKRSKLHERMRLKRTDLAPLPEWFKKLDDYAEFERLAAEFLRTA